MSNKATHFKDGKKEIRPVLIKGEAMDTCATFNKKYICCRVHVLKSVHNCPFECSYCFLQNYLTDGATKVVTDINKIMDEVREKVEKQPWRLFRIGTWELGDSLALETETGQAAKLIREFSGLKNAVLELKTKSDCIDSILNIEDHRNTVISWSLNSEHITKTEEHKTAPLERRLEAISKCVKAGYLIGLHFDPMIFHEGWERNYAILVERVFDAVHPDNVAWISIGSLRFNPEMKKKIENNYPDSRLTCTEMVLGDDAKMRYVKPLRLCMYKSLYSELLKHINKDSFIYFCMERWDIWEKVFGHHPDSIGHLDYLFAESIYKRFGLGKEKPERELYEKEIED